ncbi:hypothetical protein IFM89_018953 [Coptis chinensis]|uniref:Uncharacterized protein n=1 Tax=Coptis chinensis TaxID=261450 RepID=A0A835M5D8_9MAGN|nr:hypothetical protein IFM89_018953 [Coptis chinensis]
MATTHLFFSTSLPIPFSSSFPKPQNPKTTLYSSLPSNFTLHGNRKGKQCFAAGSDLLGDFGGRDPFPAEIESKFGDKVLGYCNTEHKILIPNISALSLAQQECTPSLSPLSAKDAQQLIRKVIGWRLVDDEGRLTTSMSMETKRLQICG